MTTVMQLISKFGAAGIRLWLDDDGQLRFKAPKGALTPELKAALLEQKDAVMDFLNHSKTDQVADIVAIERNAEQQYPLSFAQQRFWFLDRLEPGNPSLHIPAAIRIRGALQEERLQAALEQLVARHESLRTSLVLTDEQTVWQKIHDPFHWPLAESIGLGKLPAEAQEQRLNELMQQEALKPFDLYLHNGGTPSLMRTTLLRLSADTATVPEHVLLITLHHIIADGWSLNLLIKELVELYRQKQPAGSAPLPISYIDFSAWQQQWLGNHSQQHLDYWKQQLQDIPLLELPTDFPRPKKTTHHGASIHFHLDTTLATALKNLARQKNLSPFIVLLATFQILLSRYTQQDDICTGIPVAGRNRLELENIIGCFINLLAIRNTVNGQSPANDFLLQVRNTVLAAQEHQDIPFELVAEACTQYRSLAHTPIFQVLFTHRTESLAEQLQMDKLQLELLQQDSLTSKYDLQLHIDQQDDALQGTIEFNTGLFRTDTMQDFGRHYGLLLKAICENPDRALQDLDFLDASDQQKLLPHTPYSPPKTSLLALFDQALEKHGNRTAVSCGEDTLTYKELHEQSNALALLLQEKGAGSEKPVGICLPAGTGFMVALLGVIKSGACYVPMDNKYPQDRLQHMIDNAAMSAVITQSSLAEKLQGCAQLITLDTLDLQACSQHPDTSITAEQLLYIIYTSGSTGLPKGACVSHQNEINLLQWYTSHYGMDASDKVLVISALGFDLTQKNLLAPLLCGAEIVFSDKPRYDPANIVDIIHRQGISWINCAPSAFYPLVDNCTRQGQMQYLHTLRHVLFGGEPIVLENLQDWIKHPGYGAKITNMYGPTECTDITCAYTLEQPQQFIGKSIPVGTPVPGVDIYILDEQLHLLPTGATGELYIGGASVGKGYFRQPELTAASFIHNPYGNGILYRTRDLVRYARTDNGLLLEFVSRNDDQIKIRGFRVEPGEIASRLMQHKDIKEALVISERNSNGAQQLIAYYTSRNGQALPLTGLREHLKMQLPDYMIPAAFVDIQEWPLSANGKIDRKALPKPQEQHTAKALFVTPQNHTQQQLAGLWQELLSVSNIGIHDNFFELGGHSLMATRLAGKIAQVFGTELSLNLFFEKPTIAELAGEIDKGHHINALHHDEIIHPVERSQNLPLSFAQERLWIIEQITPGNSAYNIPFALKLSGTLDKPALAKAINTIVERHETLRTMIKPGADGNARQDIRPASEFRLAERQLAQLPTAGELQALMAETANTAFDLSKDLLFRAELITVNENEHLLLACMHHIISDGWSLGILQQELQTLYKAYAGNVAEPVALLPALPHQYADFAVWQRQHSDQEKARQDLDYWLTQLDKAPAFITLPVDKPRPAQQTFNGAMLTMDLPEHLLTGITAYSLQHGTTPFTVLLSAYTLLLGKYARQEDICIGTPVSGRDKASLQGLIGYFVNAVVIRNRLSGNPDFYALVQRTQQTCSNAFAHQDVAIEQVLDKLQLPRNASYSPVAQVGFSYINAAFTPAFDITGLDIHVIDIDKVVAKYDLTMIAAETGNGLQIHLEYNTDLFVATSIANMYRHFLCILEQCLAQPATPAKAVRLLDHTELLHALDVNADETENILPLTPMQYDMVMSQWLNPQSLANTLGYRAEVDFAVDADAWEKAIELVSLQQPVTRTHFKSSRLAYGDFAWQCVYKHLPIELDVMDYRDAQLTEDEIQEKVDAFIYQPQAYQKNRFIRYGLMRLPGPRTILLLSSHHALLDGVSIVLIAELTARYYTAVMDRFPVNDVGKLPLAFVDYIGSNIQAIDNSETLDFWQQRFKDCEALDFSVDNNETSHQAIRVHHLPAGLWKNLKTWCRKNRTTPAQLLKVLYAVLIANYCRAGNDFYFSEFHAGRDRNTATALGCYFLQSPFIFATALLQKDTTITALLDYARDFRKGIKPFDAISMGMTRQLAPQGRLHFMFNYYHFFPQNQQLQGYPITCIETPPFIEQTVQFVIKEHEEDCQLDLYYQTGSFNDYDLLQRLEHLCEQIVAGTTTLGELSLVFADEKARQVQAWNDTGHDLPPYLSLQAWFEQQVAATPKNIAIIDDNGTITYRELNSRANRIAHFLQQQGIGRDQRVGLCMNRCIDTLCVILGIIKSGSAYVPIDASYPEQRIRYMLDNAGIRLLFTQQEYSALFSQHTGLLQTIVIDDAASLAVQAITQTADDRLDTGRQLQDMLYVIFTSGSTGNPKGATVTHQGEINLLQWYTREFAFTEESSNLIISALGFDLTQKNLFAPLLTGGRLVLSALEHYDSGAIHKLIEKHDITHINCAPSAFYPLVEDHGSYHSLATLRTVILGGEPVKCERLAAWFLSDNCQAELVNNYGPTECTDISAFYRVQNIADFIGHDMPIGKPNDNVQAYIMNPLQQLLPAGLIGEICIGGTGVGRGYLGNDAMNGEKFIANPFSKGQLYRTGDLGRYLPDGNILFHIRADFQVKLNGLRIELAEIEHAIRQNLVITDTLVVVSDGQLLAYAAGKSLALPADWKDALAKTLPAYMVPQHLIILERWPLTPNGKIDRNALPKPQEGNMQAAYVAARNETEQVICDIVRRILGVERVGIHDNFFDLGGHSLAASRAIVQIREHFQMDIPLNVLFEMTTVEKLATYIKAAQWALQSAQNHQEDDKDRDTGFI